MAGARIQLAQAGAERAFLLSHLSGAAEFRSVVLMGSWHSIFVWASAFGVSGMNGSPERVAMVLEYDDTMLMHCTSER